MANQVKKDWTTKAGLRAVVLFVNGSHHCGYVQVPDDHPGHGVDEFYNDAWEGIEVHGGITYCEAGDGVYPVEDADGWWVGFDCAHYGDAVMSEYDSYLDPTATFKDVDYVASECESLARQLQSAVDAK